MDTTRLNIEDLVYYKQNNKVHTEEQVKKIAMSIKEFGFVQPIVVDKNNEIIIGHGRYIGAKFLELETVPVVVADKLSEIQVRKLRILDNKLNESERDLENLKLELDDLGDMNIGGMEISISDMFPDFDAPTFDPNEYDDSLSDSNPADEGKIAITVFVANQADGDLLERDLKDLGYTDIKR